MTHLQMLISCLNAGKSNRLRVEIGMSTFRLSASLCVAWVLLQVLDIVLENSTTVTSLFLPHIF